VLEVKFTTNEREYIRKLILARAEMDPTIISAASFGSAAVGEDDEWSDIDLGFRIAPDKDHVAVCEDWTVFMKRELPITDTLNVWSQGAIYRVFLLDNTLQIDLSFWPYEGFTIIGSKFQLHFGNAQHLPTPSVNPTDIIGQGWLYLIHARSYLARGRYWQTRLMLEEVRNRIFMLACLRNEIAYNKGKGIDLLPVQEIDAISVHFETPPGKEDLAAAYLLLSERYLYEVSSLNQSLAEKLNKPISVMQGEVALYRKS